MDLGRGLGAGQPGPKEQTPLFLPEALFFMSKCFSICSLTLASFQSPEMIGSDHTVQFYSVWGLLTFSCYNSGTFGLGSAFTIFRLDGTQMRKFSMLSTAPLVLHLFFFITCLTLEGTELRNYSPRGDHETVS